MGVHCTRIDRHAPHGEDIRSMTWGTRRLQCDGLPVVEGGSEAAERCEDCNARLLPENRATTCLAHRLCRECEPHRADSCSDCYFEADRMLRLSPGARTW